LTIVVLAFLAKDIGIICCGRIINLAKAVVGRFGRRPEAKTEAKVVFVGVDGVQDLFNREIITGC
jgi:hypothetical protein